MTKVQVVIRIEPGRRVVGRNVSRVRRDGDRRREVNLLPTRRSFVRRRTAR